MKTTLRACAAFAVGATVPALALSAALAFSRQVPAEQAFDDWLLTAYVMAVLTLLFTCGFGLVTAFSARWRGLPVRRVVMIAGLLGLLAPLAAITGVSTGASVLIPMFRAMPRVEGALVPLLTGAVLGGAAVLIARAKSAA